MAIDEERDAGEGRGDGREEAETAGSQGPGCNILMLALLVALLAAILLYALISPDHIVG